MMVVVVSNHDATTDATGEEALFLLCMCHLFGWSKSYVQVFFFFLFFLQHGLLSILVAPEIISGDYWGAAGGWGMKCTCQCSKGG